MKYLYQLMNGINSQRKTIYCCMKNLPSDSSKNSRALPLSHLIVGRISNTFLPCVSFSFG